MTKKILTFLIIYGLIYSHAIAEPIIAEADTTYTTSADNTITVEDIATADKNFKLKFIKRILTF